MVWDEYETTQSLVPGPLKRPDGEGWHLVRTFKILEGGMAKVLPALWSRELPLLKDDEERIDAFVSEVLADLEVSHEREDFVQAVTGMVAGMVEDTRRRYALVCQNVEDDCHGQASEEPLMERTAHGASLCRQAILAEGK